MSKRPVCVCGHSWDCHDEETEYCSEPDCDCPNYGYTPGKRCRCARYSRGASGCNEVDPDCQWCWGTGYEVDEKALAEHEAGTL